MTSVPALLCLHPLPLAVRSLCTLIILAVLTFHRSYLKELNSIPWVGWFIYTVAKFPYWKQYYTSSVSYYCAYLHISLQCLWNNTIISIILNFILLQCFLWISITGGINSKSSHSHTLKYENLYIYIFSEWILVQNVLM